jgi:hypothetical protein
MHLPDGVAAGDWPSELRSKLAKATCPFPNPRNHEQFLARHNRSRIAGQIQTDSFSSGIASLRREQTGTYHPECFESGDQPKHSLSQVFSDERSCEVLQDRLQFADQGIR